MHLLMYPLKGLNVRVKRSWNVMTTTSALWTFVRRAFASTRRVREPATMVTHAPRTISAPKMGVQELRSNVMTERAAPRTAAMRPMDVSSPRVMERNATTEKFAPMATVAWTGAVGLAPRSIVTMETRARTIAVTQQKVV
jgi:hypothetical protein